MENLERIRALEEAAIRDFLTGLHNRRFLREVGAQLFAGLGNGQQTLCAAMLDVDFFKKVNDTYGHEAGDAVLQKIGALLKKQFVQPHVVARIGGEEFCMLLVNMSQSALEALFEKVRLSIQESLILHNNFPVPITVSIGVSTQVTNTLNELLNQADAALYIAKHTGRNRVVFHQPVADPSA